MSVIKKFVGQLTVGADVQIKRHNGTRYELVDCHVENIEWHFEDPEFESATLHLRLPNGDLLLENWYTSETIRTYVY